MPSLSPCGGPRFWPPSSSRLGFLGCQVGAGMAVLGAVRFSIGRLELVNPRCKPRCLTPEKGGLVVGRDRSPLRSHQGHLPMTES